MLNFCDMPQAVISVGSNVTIVTLAAARGGSTPHLMAAVIFGTLGLFVLWGYRRRVAGTTMSGPWAWAAISIAAITLSEVLVALFAGSQDANWVGLIRYSAAVTTICPLVAVLGAKRPQQQAWHLIVLTMLGVMHIPILETLLFGGQHDFSRGLWPWLLVIMTPIGVFNILGTRFWAPGLLAAAAQGSLLFPFLPFVQREFDLSEPVAGGPIAGLAMLVVAATVVRWIPAPAATTAADRLWFDFRDLYGHLWSQRVLERVNDVAKSQSWPIRLSWNGVVDVDDTISEDLPKEKVDDADAIHFDPESIAALERLLRQLVLRFVSPEWVDARFAEPDPEPDAFA